METRRVQRIKTELKGRIEVPEETKKKVMVLKGIHFKTHNISPSGALLILTHYLPKGIGIDLIISGDKKKRIPKLIIPVEVIYCKFVAKRAYKLGVRFQRLGEKEKKFIQDLLNKYR